MRKHLLFFACVLALAAAPRGAAISAEPSDSPKDKPAAILERSSQPITTARGEVGDLLRKWWEEGTAAGNAGDWYDNRDGGHSNLNTAPYPQLSRVEYSEEDKKAYRHWAAQRVIRPAVTFGNSSTSAQVTTGGSNVRSYYVSRRGLEFLYQQYTHNNLYIYPEHRDHDAGHNGYPAGYGDLYPTNTPYLITSQGSSGSDQPFMRAIPYTLAALRPEVKTKLIERGLICPTMQMILRSTAKHLAAPEEYLTGKAHPTVLEGANVSELAMVKLAHEITLETIPAVAQLRVVEQDLPEAGKDFFEPVSSEVLADTPAVIARIWRGAAYRRRMVVSAEESYDPNDRPLAYHWVVLRGDPARVEIRKLDEAGKQAEIRVAWHPRQPIAPGSAMESSRVDLGVFVHNGAYYSAPALITFFMLDSENRTYAEDGRVLEIAYGAETPALAVTDWGGLLKAADSDGLAGKLLPWPHEQRRQLAALASDYERLKTAAAEMAQARQEAEKARQDAIAAEKKAQSDLTTAEAADRDNSTAPTQRAKADAAAALEAATKNKTAAELAAAEARSKADAATREADGLLSKSRPELGGSIKTLVEEALQRLAADQDLYNDYAKQWDAALSAAMMPRQRAVEAARRGLAEVGLAEAGGTTGRLNLSPTRSGLAPADGRLTAYEQGLLGQYHAMLLSELAYPSLVAVTLRSNFVDARLASPKAWRDVYQYDSQGNLTGWIRHGEQQAIRYQADGLAIQEEDSLGRVTKARRVRYVAVPVVRSGVTRSLLTPMLVDGDEGLVEYIYDGPEDRQGRVKS